MPRTPQPRRHHHLSRESIGRAALDLVDRKGAEALSLRAVAASLGVDAMNLYPYIGDRDGMIREIIALLVSEIDVSDRPGMAWEECVVAIGLSIREMALRHPHAFIFLALADNDEWPLPEYTGRIERLLVSKGVPAELLPPLGRILDAHSMGALLFETHDVIARQAASHGAAGSEAASQAPFEGSADPRAEFEEDTRAIIAGVKLRHGIVDGPPSGGADESGDDRGI